ncbi:MAG: hypothetical protein JXP73_04750, partial [Deltaproteobacteria bacterium]|nr:hypothetical protein [Deltaproteobacteria bacterium]
PGSMMLDEIFERFAARSPITVMAHLGLERVLEPSWFDEVFDVVERLRAGQPPPCPGYRVRVVDGNCLAPTSQPHASSKKHREGRP